MWSHGSIPSNNEAIGVVTTFNETGGEYNSTGNSNSTPSKLKNRLPDNVSEISPEELEKQVRRYNVLWTFVSCGYMMSWTAIGSLITYFQARQGAAFYVALYCFFYLPGLPVSLLQERFDNAHDRKYGSSNTFMVRVCISMAIKVFVLFYMPSIPDDFKHHTGRIPYVMLTCMCVIGICSWLANGTVTQMCSMFPPSSTMYFQTGQRAPVIIVCIGTLWNKNVPASEARFDRVCHTTALFVTIGWLAFVILARSDPGMHYFAQKDLTCDTLRQETDEENSSLLPQKSHRYERNDIPIEHESESQVAVAVRRCRISIFLNVWSSILVAAFFAYVEPASGSLTHNIGTILYFTRLFSDLLGRPAARMMRPGFLQNDKQVLRANWARMIFIVLFFLYILGGGSWFPQNDILIILIIFTIFFTCGYLVVLSYEYAPMMVHTKAGKATAGTLMNSTFQWAQSSAVVLGVLMSQFMKDPY